MKGEKLLSKKVEFKISKKKLAIICGTAIAITGIIVKNSTAITGGLSLTALGLGGELEHQSGGL